jgi:Raf kinase inhibitor-like YbhB/YbcL family protein
MPTSNDGLTVRSTAFSHNGHIPPLYTCEGKNINPQLEIKNIPGDTRTIALIMEDPDAPSGVFDHWIVWNIPPADTILENSNPGISGTTSFGSIGYGGPCPPSGQHRYFIKVFALDDSLDLPAGSGKQELLAAMEGHILAAGELMGLYEKKKSKGH